MFDPPDCIIGEQRIKYRRLQKASQFTEAGARRSGEIGFTPRLLVIGRNEPTWREQAGRPDLLP
jgi:hypothetical protein